MKIENMREFIVFSRYMSFTAAAKHLFVTQPTLSYRIASMEKELGFELVDRTEPMHVTAAGKVFLEECQRIVAQYDETLRRCADVARMKRRNLMIERPAGNPAVSSVLSQAINAFVRQEAKRQEACPTSVTFALSRHMSLVEVLRRGKADVGLVFDPDTFEHMDEAGDVPERGELAMASLPVPDSFDRGVYVALPVNDPLAAGVRSGSSMRLKDLEGRPVAIQGDLRFAVGIAAFRAIFARGGAGVGFRAKVEEDDIDFLWDVAPDELIVSDSQLISLMQGAPYLVPDRMVARIDDPLAVFAPCLVWLSDNNSEPLRDFLSFVTGNDKVSL